MKLLERLRKYVAGTLTGSCIVLLNPITPIGTGQQFYTLEELSYQDTKQEQTTGKQGWSYQWVYDKGFVLQPNRRGGPAEQPVRLRRAVYRSIVE